MTNNTLSSSFTSKDQNYRHGLAIGVFVSALVFLISFAAMFYFMNAMVFGRLGTNDSSFIFFLLFLFSAACSGALLGLSANFKKGILSLTAFLAALTAFFYFGNYHSLLAFFGAIIILILLLNNFYKNHKEFQDRITPSWFLGFGQFFKRLASIVAFALTLIIILNWQSGLKERFETEIILPYLNPSNIVRLAPSVGFDMEKILKSVGANDITTGSILNNDLQDKIRLLPSDAANKLQRAITDAIFGFITFDFSTYPKAVISFSIAFSIYGLLLLIFWITGLIFQPFSFIVFYVLRESVVIKEQLKTVEQTILVL